ncbi:kinase-like protein [Gigaspora margarita]|uniref:Kinase-like protein n=1 Tax=Gigaspora margarita TaxID=4874 RepID=A0A8H3X2D3_GIGMA|nr:kinase-like protein [Gigaspora margarita]
MLIRYYLINRPKGYYGVILYFANDGNLREYLNQNLKLSWAEKLCMATEITQGLNSLHFHNIIHRDLHSKNILIHQGNALVADFGLAKKINESQNHDIHGISAYTEPQFILNGLNHRNKKHDIYSLGIVLWEISSGKLPFKDIEDQKCILSIIRETREVPVEDAPIEYK